MVTLMALLAAGAWPPRVHVQQPPSGPAAVETIQIRPNVYVIFGAGGNVVMHLGQEGAILVDSGSATTADRVVAEIRKITRDPVRLIINTSADPDHIGGNERVAREGFNLNPNAFNAGAQAAGVLAHENVLNRVSAPTGQQPPFPVALWPTETYISRIKSMYVNGDGVQVIHFPAAHSDGDSVVFFRRADVVVTGDILDLRRFPVIDASAGGTVQGELEALNALLELAIPAMPFIYQEGRTYIVPGHGRIADHAELVEYRDMVTTIRDRIQSLIQKELTLEQIRAANPTQGYRARYGAESGPWTTDMFVEAVYRSLTAARKS
jgi:glyoxylase-like metal-dependent hydrolase (beta-lactamase superfamily II)